jgi:hypothetical protein
VEVAVAEHGRARGQLGRHVVQLGAQLGLLGAGQLLVAQALEEVFAEVVQLPGELGLVEGEAAGDGVAVEGEPGRGLYVGDELDGALGVRLALVLGRALEEASELVVAEVLLDDDP